jgi:hypothetical protein
MVLEAAEVPPEDKENSRMRKIFNRTSNEKFGASEQYSHVAALLIRWDDELDQDLKCKDEVCNSTVSAVSTECVRDSLIVSAEHANSAV